MARWWPWPRKVRHASVLAQAIKGRAIVTSGSVSVNIVSGGATVAPLWSADFESGVYGDYMNPNAAWDWPAPSSAPVVTTSNSYSGSRSCKFTIPGGGRRCEGTANAGYPATAFHEGDDYWFSGAVMFENVQNTSEWQVITQWKNDGYGSPPVALSLSNGRFELSGGYGYPGSYTAEPGGYAPTMYFQDLNTAFSNNVWYRWVFHIKFSKNPAIGTVDAWRNGTQVLTNFKPTGGTLYPVTVDSYIKYGYYRSANILTTGSVYHDDLKIGATVTSVGGI